MRRQLLPLLLLAVCGIALLGAVAEAHAARRATVREVRLLAAATASFSRSDALALDARGRLIERDAGVIRRFVQQGYFVSSHDRRWARVVVATTRSERYSTVLRLVNGRWRAVASGGLNGRHGADRDGRACAASRIPRLAAIDLALGRTGAFDVRRRCEGPWLARVRRAPAADVATSDSFPVQEDYGNCTLDYPGSPGTPIEAWRSRARPAWTMVRVWCTSGGVSGVEAIGEFGAILRSGSPVERISLSDVRRTQRCTNRGLLRTMPLVARLQLGICAVPDPLLDNLSR